MTNNLESARPVITFGANRTFHILHVLHISKYLLLIPENLFDVFYTLPRILGISNLGLLNSLPEFVLCNRGSVHWLQALHCYLCVIKLYYGIVMWIWIVILIILWLCLRSGYETIPCMTAEETNAFLASDPDGYVNSLNKWDLYARKVSTPQEYLDKISHSGVACNIAPDLLNRADEYFKSIGRQDIADIPWKLAKTDKTYEEGYPHTRRDVIFNAPNDLEILIHEKIHVSQRLNPPDLAQMGFTYTRPRKSEYRIRSNPDISEDGIWDSMVAHYNSDTPRGIGDIDTRPELEHPYELLAYRLLRTF